MTSSEIASENLKVAIELKIKRYKYWPLKSKMFIQYKPFVVGFEITNLSEKKMPISNLAQVKFFSKHKELTTVIEGTSEIREIKPNKKFTHWLSAKIGFPYIGELGVSLHLSPKEELHIVYSTYQLDQFSKKESKLYQNNKWENIYFIKSAQDYHQNRMNILVLILTISILIESIWGIREFFQKLNEILSNILFKICP